MADKKNIEIPNKNPAKEEQNPRMKQDSKLNEKAPRKGEDYR